GRHDTAPPLIPAYRNAGMMCLANISICRTSSSQDMNPWSKNQPNHSRSPLPPIVRSASTSRLMSSGLPASAYLTCRIRSTVHSAGGRGVYGSSGYFAPSSALREPSQKPKPAEVFLDPGVVGVAQQPPRLGLVAAEVHRAEGTHALAQTELTSVLRRHVLVDVAQSLEVRRVRHQDPRHDARLGGVTDG